MSAGALCSNRINRPTSPLTIIIVFTSQRRSIVDHPRPFLRDTASRLAQLRYTLAPTQVTGVHISGARECVVNGSYIVLNPWIVRNRRSIYCKIDPCYPEPRQLLVTDRDGQWMVTGADKKRLVYSTGLAWGMYPTLATGWRQSKRSKTRSCSSAQTRDCSNTNLAHKYNAKTTFVPRLDADSSRAELEFPDCETLKVSALTDEQCAELLGHQPLLAIHSSRVTSHVLLRFMAGCEARGGLKALVARCQLAMQTISEFMAPSWLRFAPDSSWQIDAGCTVARPVQERRSRWIFCGPWMDARDTVAVTVICRSEWNLLRSICACIFLPRVWTMFQLQYQCIIYQLMKRDFVHSRHARACRETSRHVLLLRHACASNRSRSWIRRRLPYALPARRGGTRACRTCRLSHVQRTPGTAL